MDYEETQLQKDRAARHEAAQGMVISCGPNLTAAQSVDFTKVTAGVCLDSLPVAPLGFQRVGQLQQMNLLPQQNLIGMPCNCIGPQGNAPRCPCQMRGVTQRDGRWIQVEVDLGPV